MLYEIFVGGKPVLMFFTTMPFSAHDARRLIPETAEPVAIKARNFQYDSNSMVVLTSASQDSIAKVIGAYIKKEVDKCSSKLASQDLQNSKK